MQVYVFVVQLLMYCYFFMQARVQAAKMPTRTHGSLQGPLSSPSNGVSSPPLAAAWIFRPPMLHARFCKRAEPPRRRWEASTEDVRSTGAAQVSRGDA